MEPTDAFPSAMGKIAPRELAVHGIHTPEQAAGYTEKQLLAIHGVGPKAIRILKEELAKQNLELQDEASVKKQDS